MEKPAGQVGLPVPQLTVTSFNVVISRPGIGGIGNTHVFARVWLIELPGLLVVMNPVKVTAVPTNVRRRTHEGICGMVVRVAAAATFPVPEIVKGVVSSA